MGYITKEQVKKIREDLKASFPEFKFSVTNKDYSSVNVVILTAPIELRTKTTDMGYESVNLFWLKSSYKEHPEILKVLSKINEIMDQFQGEPYETADYGMQPTYYTNLYIGDWEKPFQVVEKKVKTKKLCKVKQEECLDLTKKIFDAIIVEKPFKSLIPSENECYGRQATN